MNYYDEEITIQTAGVKPHNHAKIERIPSRGSNSGRGNQKGSSDVLIPQHSAGISMVNRTTGQRDASHINMTDDDGLLQSIIDHDDDDVDEEDSDQKTENISIMQQLGKRNDEFSKQNDLVRSNAVPGHSRLILPNTKALDNELEPSETESEEGSHNLKKSKTSAIKPEAQNIIGPEKWENVQLDPEIKALFPYILKYTPQNIEIPYHLQPFIPEYIPAVGDVDAFLKVTEPPLSKIERSQEVHDHLQKLGLHFLDEPSGSQSEPSLLNMKLRSALTGNSKSSRSSSAQVMPLAKSIKDIDKWINEVEEVHMSQSIYDAQPRKDIENVIIDWPRNYAQVATIVQEAYQQCLTDQYSLKDYIDVLCQQFEINGPRESQADYLLSTQTLFALYLAANQAWE